MGNSVLERLNTDDWQTSGRNKNMVDWIEVKAESCGPDEKKRNSVYCQHRDGD